MSTGHSIDHLDTHSFSIEDIAQIARQGTPVEITSETQAKINAARAVVEKYLAADVPVYGLTTALGAGVDTRLSSEDIVAFQLRVPQARAVGVGAPLPREIVRAMMAARIAGMAAGGTGVSLPVFEGLVTALNAGFHPVVPSLGSIGAGDLAPLAHMAQALIGYGEAEFSDQILPAQEALHQAGLKPLAIAPKDGHALVVANSLSIGRACLCLTDLTAVIAWSFRSVALNFEAFRANVSAFDERALKARPAFGQLDAARRFKDLLSGSALLQDGAARRLQDPLSYRCTPQIWGALLSATAQARTATEIELMSSGDNPVVLAEEGLILSHGNFDMTAFVLAWEQLAQAITHTATATAHRIMKIMSAAMTDLPRFLTPLGQSRSGFATVQKTVSALEAEIRHLAMPSSFSPIPVADGVEDHASLAPSVIARLEKIIELFRYLVAIELTASAQAIELRGVTAELGAGTSHAYKLVREKVAPLSEDRAQGADFEKIAELIHNTE